jgi:hypothetical protein
VNIIFFEQIAQPLKKTANPPLFKRFFLVALLPGILNWYTTIRRLGLPVLLSNITALLLAAHSVFGCCWHHAHACTAESRRQCPPGHESLNIFEKSPACDSNHRSDGPKHNPTDCKELSCVFIGPLRAKVIQSDRSVSPTIFPPMQQDCFSPAIAPAGGFFRTAGRLQQPIRLHSLYMVLLI